VSVSSTFDLFRTIQGAVEPAGSWQCEDRCVKSYQRLCRCVPIVIRGCMYSTNPGTREVALPQKGLELLLVCLCLQLFKVADHGQAGALGNLPRSNIDTLICTVFKHISAPAGNLFDSRVSTPTLHLQLARCSSHVSSKNELCELSHVACPIDEQTDSPWQANLTGINGSAPFEADS
jgi:hypothetical protein